METENDEATKRHDNNFSLQNIIFTVKVSAVIAVSGYWGYPNIVSLLEGVNLWFDWFRLVLRNIFFVFIVLNALIGSIYFIFLKTTGKKKHDLYDEYIAAVPSVVRPSPEPYFAPMEVGDYGGGYYNNSSYEDIVPPFQAVNTVEESTCYEQVVMETNYKSYRRTTRSEKKMRSSTVAYQRTESERVMKTSSLRSAIDELSSEEFRMTVETFIMHKKKKMCYCPNGVADNLQNGVPQLQNGVVDQWQNGFTRLQNGFVDQWPNAVPQLQNGGVDQWQGQPDHYDGTGRRSHRSRRRKVADGSGSTGSGGPYLAISN